MVIGFWKKVRLGRPATEAGSGMHWPAVVTQQCNDRYLDRPRGACIAQYNQRNVGRSRGLLTSKNSCGGEQQWPAGVSRTLAPKRGATIVSRFFTTLCFPKRCYSQITDMARFDQGVRLRTRHVVQYSASTESQKPDPLQPASIALAT